LEDDEEPVSAEHLERVESEMRDALRASRRVYEDEKQLLKKHFKRVDDGDGAVDLTEFVALWGRIGVPLSRAEATAAFAKHGVDARGGTMPYAVFERVYTDRGRRGTGAAEAVRKGAYRQGESFVRSFRGIR
jgi:Ca2+-binding EF-hand superfamily protein